MNATLLRARRIVHATALRDQRECTLVWNDGANRTVLAREGVAGAEIDMMMGGAVDRDKCVFYVLTSLLPEAPEIDTVFSIQGRPAGPNYRLHKIRGGRPNDVEWIFECVEEHG